MFTALKRIKQKLPLRSHGGVSGNQLLVGLDIGTEYVKALIGEVSGETIRVIGAGRHRQHLSDMQAGAIADIAGVVSNCDAALRKAEDQAGVSPRNCIIGIAGELVKGTTTTITFRRSNPKDHIEAEEMRRIITRTQEKAGERAKHLIGEELGGKNIDIKLVNSALVSIMIDGYPVTNPIGFPGKDVRVQVYSAFAPLVHIGALERTAEQLDLHLSAVAAEPFAVARSVIGNDPDATMSAILIDIGGGTTDIAVVKEGGLEGTKMFGIGGRVFTRAIEREMHVSFEQAEQIKLSLSNGKLPAAKKTEIEKILQKTVDVWLSGVVLALEEFDGLDHLPHQIYLCGGGASLELLTKALRDKPWYRSLAFTKTPDVSYLQPTDVVQVYDTTGILNDHTFITAMGLLRVGLDVNGAESEGTGSVLRKKMNRIMRI